MIQTSITARLPSLAILLVLTAVGVAEERGQSAAIDHFRSSVAPLLIRRCVECHQGSDPSGGLSLVTREGLQKGGDSGPAIDPQSAHDSHLLDRITSGEMPPEKQGRAQTLSDAEIAVLRDWIAAGAAWPPERKLDYFEVTNDSRGGRDWWSLQPIVRPAVPKTATATPSVIDAFIRQQLASAGMQAARRATPAVRLRRLHSVLTGLPPTAEDIEAFTAHPTEEAWEQAIDRLLDSPQYGVRWARHWLDLVRYADTCGYERDQEKPFAWKYRDWVVDAFNADMPYDDFIIQQLAGDEMDERREATVIATGFLRLGTWNDEPNDPADYVYDRLEDLVHTTSTAFIAMTVKCARCHSHKFDPITQEDYYRMGSIFWSGPVDRGGELGGSTADELGLQEVLGWTDVPGKVAPIHLLKNGERHKPMHEVVPATLSMLPGLERQLDAAPQDGKTTRRRLQYAMWLTDPENPLTPRVFVNRIWQHHFGEGIVRSPNNFGFLADPPTHPELLDWLAAEFVEGGWQIKRIHKLILMSETWQQASTHERALSYQSIDSGNRGWWRANRRRLDAETLRDSMLEATGQLDLRLGGPGFRPTISAEALEGLSRKTAAWTASPPEEQNRRSLYTFVKRGLLPPMMTTFDLSDTTQSCGRRDSTTVPTQALTLLNNAFVHQRSQTLAKRICEDTKNTNEQIDHVWRAVLRRSPTEDERRLAKHHLTEQRQLLEDERTANDDVDKAGVESLASLVHVLFNCNEFLYVD